MSAEELDLEEALSGLRVEHFPWTAAASTLACNALRQAIDEVGRLRKVIEDAPHAHACQINWTSRENEVCDCWKASAVGTNNEEGN